MIRAFKLKYGKQIHPSRSIQTQRRFMAQMATNVEELRSKYKIMANMFLLAKMRQPSRHLYKDLEVNKHIFRLSGRALERSKFSYGKRRRGTPCSTSMERMPQLRIADSERDSAPLYGGRFSPQRFCQTKSTGCNTGF